MFRFAMSTLAFCLILSCAVNAASMQEKLEEKSLLKRLLNLLESKKTATDEAPVKCSLEGLQYEELRYCHLDNCAYQVPKLDDNIVEVRYKTKEGGGTELTIKLCDKNYKCLEPALMPTGEHKNNYVKDPGFPVTAVIPTLFGGKKYKVEVKQATLQTDQSAVTACVNLAVVTEN